MQTNDPDGIFAGGEGLFLLGVSGTKFEPRKLDMQSTTLVDTN